MGIYFHEGTDPALLGALIDQQLHLQQKSDSVLQMSTFPISLESNDVTDRCTSYRKTLWLAFLYVWILSKIKSLVDILKAQAEWTWPSQHDMAKNK